MITIAAAGTITNGTLRARSSSSSANHLTPATKLVRLNPVYLLELPLSVGFMDARVECRHGDTSRCVDTSFFDSRFERLLELAGPWAYAREEKLLTRYLSEAGYVAWDIIEMGSENFFWRVRKARREDGRICEVAMSAATHVIVGEDCQAPRGFGTDKLRERKSPRAAGAE